MWSPPSSATRTVRVGFVELAAPAPRARGSGAAASLPARCRRPPPPRPGEALDRHQQQGLAIGGRQRGERGFDAPPVSLATVDSNGDGRGVPSGHRPIRSARVRVFEQSRPAIADVEVAGDREQQRPQPRVGRELGARSTKRSQVSSSRSSATSRRRDSRARKLNRRVLKAAWTASNAAASPARSRATRASSDSRSMPVITLGAANRDSRARSLGAAVERYDRPD